MDHEIHLSMALRLLGLLPLAAGVALLASTRRFIAWYRRRLNLDYASTWATDLGYYGISLWYGALILGGFVTAGILLYGRLDAPNASGAP